MTKKRFFGAGGNVVPPAEWHQASIQQMERLFIRGTRTWQISKHEWQALEQIVGTTRRPHNVLACNMALRTQAFRCFAAALGEMAQEDPGLRFVFITLISSQWASFDRTVMIDLVNMQDQIYAAMAEGNFTGWTGVVEVQACADTVLGRGRTILPNFHAIAWSDDSQFDFAKAEALMLACPRLFSAIDAPTVAFGQPTQLHADLPRLAAYMFKAPCVAKRLVSTNRGPRFRDASLRPNLAVRLLECLSMLELPELILSSGKGILLRNKLVNALRNIGASKLIQLRLARPARLWLTLRTRSNKARYLPVYIRRRSNRAQRLPCGSRSAATKLRPGAKDRG